MFVRVLFLCGSTLLCPLVFAGINTPPELLSPSVYRAVGQPNATYDVLNGFFDPEGNGIGSIMISGVTGAATAGTTGTTITLTPNNPAVPTAVISPYLVFFTVCDDGVPSECAGATMTVFYNDPPILTPEATNTSSGGALGIPFSEFFISTGVLHGDNPSDGDTDAIASTTVSGSAVGPFNTLAVLAGGSDCSVTATDTSNLTFNASSPDSTIVETCYVRVCEEVPAATLAVCSVSTVSVTINVQPELLLKDGFEDIE